MRSFEQALALLGLLAKDVGKLQRQQKEILSAANLNAGYRTDRADAIASEIEKKELERIGVLKELVRYPPRYIPYTEPLDQFVEAVISRGDLAHLVLFAWAIGASALLAMTLRDLLAANRRFDEFVRELSTFNRRQRGGPR